MSQQEATQRTGTNSDPIQSVVQKLVASITESINSQDLDAIATKTRLLLPLIELQERYGGRPSISTEIEDIHKEMKDMDTKMDEINQRLATGRLLARIIPLILVVVAIVAYPFYGMVTHMGAQNLVQYLTPVSGLAGAIIGYWFGREGGGS